MSEAEKKRRSDYKKKRANRILLQTLLLVLVALIAAVFAATYYRVDQTYYIHYTEDGAVDYRVQLLSNEFYEEEWQESGQTYVTNLVDTVVADFKYDLGMSASNVTYRYSYGITGRVEVKDKVGKGLLYQPEFELVPETTAEAKSGNVLSIREQVVLDFDQYNQLATRFISTYNLPDSQSTLVVTMNLYVLSECDAFAQNSENHYFITLRIPLTTRTTSFESSTSVASDETKVLACSADVNRNLYKAIAIAAGVLAVIQAIVLVVYTFKTRNHDINYAIKVKKLLANYRSYIQKISNEFDETGYQVLLVDSFSEMLYIRDTIQAPILMSENADCTSTRFLIPTSANLLYVYEIRVEDYNEIYGITDDEEEPETTAAPV